MKKCKLVQNIMNFKFCYFIFCTIICFIVLSVPTFAKENSDNVIRVGSFEETYNVVNEKGERSGYGYEYLQDIAGYAGWTYKYITSDWKNCFTQLENGEIDILGDISYTDERAENMLFSDMPMGEEKYYIYTDASNMDLTAGNLDSFEGKNIGVSKDNIEEDVLNEWESKYGLHTKHINVSTTPEIMDKLSKHEIDCFVSVEESRWEESDISPLTSIGETEIYFAINPERPDIKQALDSAMRRIKDDNPFYTDDLYRRYLSAQSSSFLSKEEREWIGQHGAIRIGYLNQDGGISSVDPSTGKLTGVITDYVDLAENCLQGQTLEFELKVYDTRSELLQALQDGKIDLIFHTNQNPYFAETKGVALSDTLLTLNMAAITAKDSFDENKENTVAVRRNNLLGKWYISFNYPFWKIKEYDSSDEVEKAVHSGEADCFVVKAGQSLKTMTDSKMRSIFLTKSGNSCFAVTRDNTTLMNILNKTIQTLPASRLSSQFCVYENEPGKVTLAEYIKDNLRAVSIGFVSTVLVIIMIIVYLMVKARKAQIQAEKANAAKSDFLFNMSHDIRTPMNALLGYSELIKRELTDPKLLDYQEKMEQSGNLLLSIINNVLDMAQIESGKVELDEDYVKIRDIYQGIYKIFQAEAEKKGIHLEMEYDVQHEHVICDETKNREIFLNLISNAVKYTASGGRITIKITELDCDRKDYMRIRTQVIDTGIGMSEEFLPSLFEAFARERNTTAGKVAGTGLGMPIIKKYIDMMYGTIEAESKLGEGSKFTVTLEYRIADKSYYEQDTEKSIDMDETDRISGKHILLAEDNDLNAEIAEFILEDMGLMVDRVEDGVQCVSRIEQKPAGTYDLILMDIQMPNMDGYKATEVIRGLSDKSKANIPIIAMTANAFEEDRKKALAKGMNGHIAKPVDIEKVRKILQNTFKQ